MVVGIVLDDTLDKEDGVQKAVLDIGKGLQSRGHEVHYIVSETKRTDIENVHSVGRFFSLKFNGNSVRTPLPASKSKIRKLFTEVDFDVLYVQMPYSPLLAARVLKMAPNHVKKFGIFHILPYNFIAKYGTYALGIVMKKSIRSLQHCFAVSSPAKKFMDSAFSVRGSVLPNPVDYAFFSKFKKQSTKKKQIVFVGRFDERKGVKQLLAAYERLAHREDIELVVCGKGPLHAEVKSAATSKGLSVVFPGFVSDDEKAQYLANADVAVFPSLSGESFGIVLTEAMSAGAGITIGGNNPGYASVLEPWPESLFDPNNAQELAQLIERCIDDSAFAHKIGRDQRECVKQYDIEAVVGRLIEEFSI